LRLFASKQHFIKAACSEAAVIPAQPVCSSVLTHFFEDSAKCKLEITVQ
jgi:hypothetical protein